MGSPHGDARAQARTLYEVTRLLYDATKSGWPKEAPGEPDSLGTVANAAMADSMRAARVMCGDRASLSPPPD